MRKHRIAALIALLAAAGLTFGQEKDLSPAPAGPACDSPLCDTPPGTDAGCSAEPGNTWFAAEYLLWWLKDAPTPGRGFGEFPSEFDYGVASGIRVLGGIDSDDRGAGLEGSFFILERRADAHAGAVPAQGLATPFVFLPAGTAATVTGWDRFWGGDALIRMAVDGAAAAGSAGVPAWKVDLLGGCEYLNLGERADRLAVDPGLKALAIIQTRNQFYGGEFGVRVDWQAGRFFFNVAGKCGLGDGHQSLSIDSTNIVAATTTALSIHPSTDVFAVVPQVTLNVGYDITRNMRISVGYDFLDWNNVIRPGDQVAVVAPGGTLLRNDFWAQGLHIGAGIRF